MKLIITLLTALVITSCGKVETPEEFLDITGDKGKQGEVGQSGVDGVSPDFQVSGQLGLYKEEADDNRSFNLTCMLGESNDFGKAVLRIITGSGGMITVRKAGGAEETIYMPANKAVYLYSNSNNGTFIVDNGVNSKTKACNP